MICEKFFTLIKGNQIASYETIKCNEHCTREKMLKRQATIFMLQTAICKNSAYRIAVENRDTIIIISKTNSALTNSHQNNLGMFISPCIEDKKIHELGVGIKTI